MKKLVWLLLLSATPAVVAQSSMNQPPAGTVVMRSEVEDLAAGFAAGFRAIGGVPVYLTYVREGKATVLLGVKALEAIRGVLIVSLDSGQTYLLNPRDVISISDAPPPKS